MKFTAKEVEDLVWDYAVETIEGENRRWTRTNTSIVEKDGKFYELYWEQALTENQEHEYEDQDAPEVKLEEKTVVVKQWVEVK